MTQFLFLLAGIAIGWLLLQVFKPRSLKRLVFMTVFFPLVAFLALWIVAFLSEPVSVLVYPDPLYFPNYTEMQKVPIGERVINGLEKSTKTFIYGYIGLGITLYFRGKDRIVGGMKKGSRQKEP